MRIVYAHPLRLHALVGSEVQTANAAMPMLHPHLGFRTCAGRRLSAKHSSTDSFYAVLTMGRCKRTFEEVTLLCLSRRHRYRRTDDAVPNAGRPLLRYPMLPLRGCRRLCRLLTWTLLCSASWQLVKITESPAWRSQRGICFAGHCCDTEKGGSGSGACAPLAMPRSGRKP